MEDAGEERRRGAVEGEVGGLAPGTALGVRDAPDLPAGGAADGAIRGVAEGEHLLRVPRCRPGRDARAADRESREQR